MRGLGVVLEYICYMLMAAAAGRDIRERRIPDAYSGALAAAALLDGAVQGGTGDGACWAARLAGLFFPAAVLAVWASVRPGSFGGGDVKLLAAGGLYLGVGRACAAFGLASLLCGAYLGIMLAWGRLKKRDTVPFGAFLCAGLAAAQAAGDSILRWYLGG